ncbi:MAG: hypothetical protein JO257_36820 [Deltaproteobacteria bacterium]|nr:hypothetical protein [Deltaproteobacteria bacterium]
MRVLVTGAATPLGTAIIDHLLRARDVEAVLAVDREPARLCDRVEVRAVDLRHARALHDLLWGEARDHAITTIVHVDTRSAAVTRELVVACSEHPTIQRFVYRSFGSVYATSTQNIVAEDAPLDFRPHAPAWLRERLEADLAVCAHPGGRLAIAVLRCAEVFAAGCGSALWQYLSSRACLRPIGFDPMVNLLSLADAARAFVAAVAVPAVGVFNIPGLDTLPLSRAIAESVRPNIPVPRARRPPIGPLLDGRRAREAFGYVPRTPVQWPRPWWRRLIDELTNAEAETKTL